MNRENIPRAKAKKFVIAPDALAPSFTSYTQRRPQVGPCERRIIATLKELLGGGGKGYLSVTT